MNSRQIDFTVAVFGILMVIAIGVLLTSCTKGHNGLPEFEPTAQPSSPAAGPGSAPVVTPGPTPSPAPAPSPAPMPAPSTVSSSIPAYDVAQDQLLIDQNQYRESIGQEPLIPGLSCTLYTIPSSTTSISTAVLTTVGSFEYLGNFNMPNGPSSAGNPVLPVSLQAIYTYDYLYTCSGSLVVDDNNWHSFTVSSDDGSLLIIDGVTVVNLDGTHGIQTASGSKYLQYGLHSVTIKYFDVGGSHAMIIDEDGALMPFNNVVH